MKITDIHTHGIGGYDTRGTTEGEILKIAEIQGSQGVSDILLAIFPSSVQEMRSHMETVRKAMAMQHTSAGRHQQKLCNQNTEFPNPPRGLPPVAPGPATIWGVHLEGPFLNPLKCGSLHEQSCVEPTEYVLKTLTEGFENLIKIITVAPEIQGGLRTIRTMADMGIIVSMGHSDATYQEAEEGFHAGAKGITHIFNAMRGLHHREPGIAGFGLIHQEIYAELIADPFHLHDRIVDMVFKIKNPDKIIIISDSVKETGMVGRMSGIRDDHGRLKGGSMTVAESSERLIKRGYDQHIIMKCITENPRSYLSCCR